MTGRIDAAGIAIAKSLPAVIQVTVGQTWLGDDRDVRRMDAGEEESSISGAKPRR
jgi:hypothetical protein